uniref:Ubiquitin-like domain-containing protein n=1 Tax=Hirondellea gigas TaxID=1518452 RepID=A0A6A7FXQ5_9CRUS
MLRVFAADSGQSFDIRFGPADDVAGLAKSLAKQTIIPAQDQILICHNGVELDHRYSLKSYGLIEKDMAVFLFNRKNLTGKSRVSLNLRQLDFQVPRSPDISSREDNPLFDSESILVRHFPDFKISFKAHVAIVNGFLRGGEKRIFAYDQCLGAQKVKCHALTAVVCNLNTHSNHLTTRFTEFITSFEEQYSEHQKLLDQFEPSLAELRRHKLHPVLQTLTEATLLDYVQESTFRKWAEGCDENHRNLRKKVQHLKEAIQEISESVQDENKKSPPASIDLRDSINQCQNLHQEQEAICESLQDDYNGVIETIQSIIDSGKAPSDAGASDRCKAYAHQNTHHKELIVRMEKIDQQLADYGGSFVEYEKKLSDFFYGQLGAVSDIQSQIRDLGNRLTMYEETLQNQSQVFKRFVEVQNTPKAYYACLPEISRRRAFGRRFLTEMNSMAEKLGTWRDDEVLRRENFFSKYGKGIPGKLAKCLEDQPPYCDIQTREFDVNLPEIDSYTLPSGCELMNQEEKHDDITMGSLILDSNKDDSEFESVGKLSQNLEKLNTENSYLRAELALYRIDSFDFGDAECIVDHDDQLLKMTEKARILHLEAAETGKIEREENETQFAILQVEISKQKAEIENLRQANNLLEGGTEAKEVLEKERSNHSIEISRIESEFSSKLSESEKLLTERESELRSDYDMQVARLKAQLSYAEQNVEELQSKLQSDHQSEIDRLENEFASKLSNSEQLSSDLQSKLALKDREIEEFQCRQPSSDADADAATEAQPPHPHPPLADFEQIITQSKQEMLALSAQLETKSGQFDAEIAKRIEAESELKDNSEKIRELSMNLERSEAENKTLAERTGLLIQDHKGCKRLQIDYDRLRSANEETTERLTRIANAKISYQMFDHGDLALFMKNEKMHLEAYNIRCPNYFLSRISKQSIFNSGRVIDGNPILGRILYMETHVAKEEDPAYGLEPGTEYRDLIVEHIEI